MFETNPENAAIIEKLADMLAEISIGNILTYKDANAATDRDIQHKHRYLMEAAREQAEKQLGCIFECVREVGFKRLAAEECPEVGLTALRGIRRKAKRGMSRLDRLNTNSLDGSGQRRVIAYKAGLGACALVADGNKMRTVAAAVDPASPIPPENILDMFRQKKA